MPAAPHVDSQVESPDKLSRRRMLLGAGAVVAVVGALGGGWALWQWRRFSALEPKARKLAWFLSRRVRWLELDIDDDIIELWVAEHLRFHGPISRSPRGAPDKLLQSLILSTDRYSTGRVEAQAVTAFVSYYDPHKNPCYNPLRGS